MKNVMLALAFTLLASSVGACGPDSKSESSSLETYSCSYNIDGKIFQGKSREECEGSTLNSGTTGTNGKKEIKGAEEADGVATPLGKAMCSFNVSGTVINGYSQAECKALASSLNGLPSASPAPVMMPQMPSGGGGGGVYSCAYNVNGVEERGNTEAECKALEAKYGNPFGGF